jgi:glycolate oxidase iron-sulfur subunit
MQKTGMYAMLRRSGALRLLPAGFRKMEQMLPARGPLWPKPLPEILRARVSYDAASEPGRPRDLAPRRRIGFFAGCIGSVLFDGVNRKAIELLSAAGCDVLTASAQACCGAIHHHNGAPQAAAGLARRNIDAFLPQGSEQVDLIVTSIAGCGAMLREYDHLLRDDPAYADRARAFASRVRDISEALLEVGLPPMTHRVEETITYHDACHLAHAQNVTSAPRALLASIPGLALRPLPESDMCCGAAGTYNLVQPGMATRLAKRKLRHIASTQAAICATGNVGCAMHIQSEADAAGQPLRIVHPVDLLHRAVFGA